MRKSIFGTRNPLAKLALASGLFLLAATTWADGWTYYHKANTYKVTITNITKGQYFTPFILASHKPSIQLFELGEPASEEVAAIAEGGNTAPLAEVLEASPKVKAIANTEGLLAPGESVQVVLEAKKRFVRLSLAAMLLPTNDTFVALNSVRLPVYGKKTIMATAYDAGSETNDELCASIPGPQCGGVPFSPEDAGEGFVHIASGIHGNGDLEPSEYDWRGKVAKVVIEKM